MPQSREIYAHQLVTPTLTSRVKRWGPVRLQFSSSGIIERIDSLSVARVSRQSPRKVFGAVIPGLVDAHTHLVFGGCRSAEWNQRLKGATYQEISKRGGGIQHTVRVTRATTEQALAQLARARLQEFLSLGVTTLEAKTGYGLDEATELKLLRVLDALKKEGPQSLFITFMAAHAVPRGESEASYVERILRWLPGVSLFADFQDVFVEKGYFSARVAERLLRAGQALGLEARVHAHEFGRTGGVKVATKVGALSADHLIHMSDSDMQALKRANVIPVILPGTCFFLGAKKFSPARQMWNLGLKVAIASDFNPGTNPTTNLPMMGTLAAIHQGLQLDEVLVAQTWHAALALGLRDRGILAPRMRADFLAVESEHFEALYYSYGRPSVAAVWIAGKRVR